MCEQNPNRYDDAKAIWQGVNIALKTKELTIPTVFSHNIKAKRDLELPGTLYTKYPATELSGLFLDKEIFKKGGLIQASTLQN